MAKNEAEMPKSSAPNAVLEVIGKGIRQNGRQEMDDEHGF